MRNALARLNSRGFRRTVELAVGPVLLIGIWWLAAKGYSKENRWLSDILRPTHTVFRSTSLVAQYIAVATGQGIAMLPSYVAANDRDLRPVMPELFSMRDIWLSVHEDLLHIARIKAVTAFLEKRIELDKALLTSVRGKGKRA